MRPSTLRPVIAGLAALLCGLTQAPLASAAVLTLNPLLDGAMPADTRAGGLHGSWYQLRSDARFSEHVYTDETGRTDAIRNFGWGTGIWSAGDIAHAIQGPHVTATATSVGAVSYANNVYNNTEASGSYGQWGADYQRPLAPIVGAVNNCPIGSEADAHCAAEYDYAAVFTGYLYVGIAGLYDFSVFADDGFRFTLTGSNGSVGMTQDFVAGRDVYDLVHLNDLDGLYLAQGYYGIGLQYFNHLESGVVDLGWRGPGATAWTSIDPGSLYNVPEPGTLGLACAALLGVACARRRLTASAPSRCAPGVHCSTAWRRWPWPAAPRWPRRGRTTRPCGTLAPASSTAH